MKSVTTGVSHKAALYCDLRRNGGGKETRFRLQDTVGPAACRPKPVSSAHCRGACPVMTGTLPSETFCVLKEKEIRQFGEYRTRRLVLADWDRMEANGEFTAMGM